MSQKKHKKTRALKTSHDQEKDVVERQYYEQHEFRSSPFPDAEELAKYNAVDTRFSKTLLENFQRQSEHRIFMEKLVGVSQYIFLPLLAAILCIILVGMGFYLVLQGKNIEGFAMILVPMGVLILRVIYRRHEQIDDEQ